MLTDPAASFRWQDGERLIVYGTGALAGAVETVGGAGYTLLSTERALANAPQLADAAGAVHLVAPGRVDELAAALLPAVHGDRLLAFGGGRVIDTAKALAAAGIDGRHPPVAAIPTTLSGAEMTPIHRHAAGVAPDTKRVRPAIVICDPALAGSQPGPAQAESSANALGHIAEGPLTSLRNPASTLIALEGAQLLGTAFAPASDPESAGARETLALAALLAGYVIGSSWYGLHHVLSQTVARFTPLGHGGANAIMLPWSLRYLAGPFSAEIDALSGALGTPADEFARGLAERTGTTRLRDGGVTEEMLVECAREASARPELHMTPPAPDEDALLGIYRAAW